MKTLLAALLLTAALFAGCSDGKGSDTDDGATATPTMNDGTTLPGGTTPAGTSVPAAPGLTANGIPPFPEATAILTGTVTGEALLTFELRDGDAVTDLGSLEASGDWSFEVAAPYGESEVGIFADNGYGTAETAVGLVRLAGYTVAVAYTGYPDESDSEDTVLMDPDAFPSAPLYAEQGAQHAGVPVVHDLLVAWEEATGNEVDYGWSTELQGYSVSYINGAGNPVDSALPPWWCYTVNGETASLGISLQEVAPGDSVEWVLGSGLC